mmetsp:Transcript_14016/g.21812  ORF Transcript_14016/g.21812 Transcript_14016/m.21812 type:complete len:245 (-) Transcript_14016:76-810(-)
MLRVVLLSALVAATNAFSAPALMGVKARSSAISGMKMQLWEDGKQQGKGVLAIPGSPPPATLPEDMVGYVGFDPLGFSTLIDIKLLRESELKHGRAAMLAAAGAIAQDLFTFPGVDKVIGKAKMIGAHDAFIAGAHNGNKQSFAMHQIIFWVGLIEILTLPAIFETLNGGPRAPGDFSFDPLGMGKKDSGRMALAEIKNGRLAMIGVGGMVHHYLLTGKGPLQFLTGIPNYKSCIDPHMGPLCQ